MFWKYWFFASRRGVSWKSLLQSKLFNSLKRTNQNYQISSARTETLINMRQVLMGQAPPPLVSLPNFELSSSKNKSTARSSTCNLIFAYSLKQLQTIPSTVTCKFQELLFCSLTSSAESHVLRMQLVTGSGMYFGLEGIVQLQLEDNSSSQCPITSSISVDLCIHLLAQPFLLLSIHISCISGYPADHHNRRHPRDFFYRRLRTT